MGKASRRKKKRRQQRQDPCSPQPISPSLTTAGGAFDKGSVETPELFRSIIDHTSEADRRWFAIHPGLEGFQRPCVWGEFWPNLYEDEFVTVIVTQLGPGLRSRVPFVTPSPTTSTGMIRTNNIYPNSHPKS
jgi:hypothetical protein